MAAAPSASFAYHRALAPLLWMFVCIMLVELLVVHLLVSKLWSHGAALVLSALSLVTLVWTLAFIRSLKRRPVVVDGEGVTMRLGSLRSLRVPAVNIAGIRTAWPREALNRPGILNLGLINYPNVMLDLDPPLTVRRRPLVAVAHRLDDPGGFAAAVRRLIEARA